ncbi:ABC-2 type transport system ATP-binding protein [Arboricoccus pini]|uniref:ABC-2 type transport system ATP-binding protein n=1 Tax=Arboricoccus pini TaxID=1963835 RepID=A0A212QQI2_9PROT|nr:ABC transporter ATP-binding protein [Arboricoccus pini]SNB61739.1 ABC-2 type transport system ATP-binding protein [Arboricoccus pini]
MAASPSSDHLPAQAIELKGLEKVYAATNRTAAKHALKGIDLVVPQGSFFGLLGPNGAGKSTLINILAGLVNKSRGMVEIAGIDIDRHPRRARLAIGVVPQELNFDPFFTPREIIDFQAGLYGVPARERRTEELLDAVGLLEKADAHARSLSGGMRRRLLIAKALAHRPPVVVLDEPTAGVDVELRRSLWRYMRKLNESGVTVILTTHYLEEAQELCDRIAIIDQGQVVACDTTEHLLRRLDEKHLRVTPLVPPATMPPELLAAGWSLDDQGRLNVHYKAAQAQAGQLLQTLADAGVVIADLTTSEPDLETLFVRLTHRD